MGLSGCVVSFNLTGSIVNKDIRMWFDQAYFKKQSCILDLQ